MSYPVDLHCHSTRSDGADTPAELLDNAIARGLKVLALTDHDVRPPGTIDVDGTQIDFVEYGKSKGIHVIPGTEISCDVAFEDVHIVCLGCDWDAPYFAQMEEQVAKGKIDSYKATVKALDEAGYSLTWEEVLENGGNPVPEESVQKKMLFEALERKGHFPSWADAKLFIKNSPQFSIPRTKPDPIEVIDEVHKAGGICILAHPYLITPAVGTQVSPDFREKYIDRLIDAGIDGIEARYPYDKTSYDGDLTPDEIRDIVLEKYAPRVSIISAGSDYHNDAKKGSKKIRQLGEKGLTMEEFMGNPLLAGLIQYPQRK